MKMKATQKTPGKGLPVQKSDERRFRGLELSAGVYPYVQVVYARTCEIDGYYFDMVETECINASDLVRLKGGSPEVVKALFELAIASAAVPFAEIKRILNLRKGS